MTSSQIPSRIAMPCPFGGFGSDNITPIKTVTGTDVNFPDGFPSAYGAPTDTSGKFVTRKEMNAIGNLASNDLFYHKCGGLNTFDAEFCAQIGGYPKGAVLQILDGYSIRKVMSLKDNNKVCYTGQTLTSAQTAAGLTNGSIDMDNWIYLDEKSYPGVFKTININATGVNYVTTFDAPSSGTLIIDFDNYNLTKEAYSSDVHVEESTSIGGGANICQGDSAAILITQYSDSIKLPYMSASTSTNSTTYTINWANFSMAYGQIRAGLINGFVGTSSSTVSSINSFITNNTPPIFLPKVEANKSYALCVMVGNYVEISNVKYTFKRNAGSLYVYTWDYVKTQTVVTLNATMKLSILP